MRLQEQGRDSFVGSYEALRHITTTPDRTADTPQVSAESQDLLQRTLVTDPSQRLGIADMLSHPCMNSLQTEALPV